MRVVLDSGAWIAWFADEPSADRVAPYLDDVGGVLVPAVVEFEVHRWALRHLGEEGAASIAASLRRANCVPLDGPHSRPRHRQSATSWQRASGLDACAWQQRGIALMVPTIGS